MDLKQKTYLLVTGASRGIGREMAIQLAQRINSNGSVIVLLGRSQPELEQTKAQITAAVDASHCYTYSLELAKASATDFAKIINETLQGSKRSAADFERAFVLHNAGTVGDTSQYARNAGDVDTWTAYFHTNLFSAIALNTEFMRVFAAVPKLVVNISTKAAVEPFPSMSYYCTVKAAREMFFRVLAEEETENGNTLVLNYAPGAIDTQMTVLVQQQTHNAAIAELFRKQRESKSMLTTAQTVQKFIAVLEAKQFKSGDHVDYWD